MTLDEVLRRLDRLTNWEARPRDGMRVGLEPASDLARMSGDPQKGLRIVQIAGTKGKGSVASLIDAGLRAAGYRTGRYASPTSSASPSGW